MVWVHRARIWLDSTAARRPRCGDFDNASRAGVLQNLEWLCRQHGNLVNWVKGDARDAAAVKRAMAGCQLVFHFAAQVAVTTSVQKPQEDFRSTPGEQSMCWRQRDSSPRPGSSAHLHQ